MKLFLRASPQGIPTNEYDTLNGVEGEATFVPSRGCDRAGIGRLNIFYLIKRLEIGLDLSNL